jgi:hypothetical protein
VVFCNGKKYLDNFGIKLRAGTAANLVSGFFGSQDLMN